MSMVVSMLTPRCFYGFTRLSKSLLYANYEIKHLRVQYFVTTIDNLAYTTLTRNLRDEYDIRKQKAEEYPLPGDVDPKAVYANNELNLDAIDVYGFDFDYTLIQYKGALHNLIYNLGRERLVNHKQYPAAIMHLEYNPAFAVRGLHCDVQKGLLMKIDSFHNIQMGSVYRGLTALPDSEVQALYGGTHVSIMNMNTFYGMGTHMYQLMDLFALPEITLFANIIQSLEDNQLTYDPEYVFNDVRHAIQGLHSSGYMHQLISENLDEYAGPQPHVSELLHKLSNAGKSLFLITNSSTDFVNKGMSYIVGKDWNMLFDVIVTNAKKPKFFYKYSRPFRRHDAPDTRNSKSWHKVEHFDKGQIYQEGNFMELAALTGWHGSRVLYFGDHVYTDLADVTLKHGWRTGAIIPELSDDITKQNTDVYKRSLRWLNALEDLIESVQVIQEPEAQAIVAEWLKERERLRQLTKQLFNPHFGSIFRTYHNPTYFTRRLNRFADIYMSSVGSLLPYSLSHTFYPRRTALPHELDDHWHL